MNNLKRGALVRVTACPAGEYLTVGETYRVDATPGKSINATVGLHRPTNGAGTYLQMWKVRRGIVVLEAVAA